MASEYLVEPLNTRHDRRAFDCGVDALNLFLQTQARKEMERRSAVTYVLVEAEAPTQIVGYYSLSSASVLLDALPEESATRLGRLAISSKHAGKGLGKGLLWDALNRSEEASQKVGSVAVIVDAKDDAAASFYERYGFRPLPESPHRLFITMATVAATRAAAE